jgi:hypothetical protein
MTREGRAMMLKRKDREVNYYQREKKNLEIGYTQRNQKIRNEITSCSKHK